ncbi:hypothetical protein [Hydrogenimonas sp.]
MKILTFGLFEYLFELLRGFLYAIILTTLFWGLVGAVKYLGDTPPDMPSWEFWRLHLVVPAVNAAYIYAANRVLIPFVAPLVTLLLALGHFALVKWLWGSPLLFATSEEATRGMLIAIGFLAYFATYLSAALNDELATVEHYRTYED